MTQIKTRKWRSRRNQLILLITLVFIVLSAALIHSLLSQRRDQAYLENQYNQYCGSCHITPDITKIPKHLWKDKVLPEMALRMGLERYSDGSGHLSNLEKESIEINSGYPEKPLIDSLKWQELRNYIIGLAPDSIHNTPDRGVRNSKLIQFESSVVILNKNKPKGGIVNIAYNQGTNEVLVGDVFGQLHNWKSNSEIEMKLNSPIVSSIYTDSMLVLTEIGIMNPSEISRGIIYESTSDTIKTIAEELHRPVFTEINDLNDDGVNEIIVCEFGHLTGELSLLIKEGAVFNKKTLLDLPGSIKVEVTDLNHDGKKDIIALFAQGREGIYVFYQKDNLEFTIDPVIVMPPEYGSSWFSLFDYNKDGHLDILLANGDNADYSRFLKPYHGLRLYINNGENKFDEKWFYPINGASRVLVEDFDMDGDPDFAVLSFFPDFDDCCSQEGFVYLENKDSENYLFTTHVTNDAKIGNWLVMEKGDYDQDGDVDIALGNFNMLAPDKFKGKEKCDLLFLKNNYIQN